MNLLDQARAYISNNKRAYQLTFQTHQPANMEVLADLIRFCRGHESTFHADPRISANLDGRREVLLRIQNYLGLSEEQLLVLYSGNIAAINKETTK